MSLFSSRIKLLTTAAGPEFAYCAGFVVDAKKSHAATLVEAGAAVYTTEPLTPMPQEPEQRQPERELISEIEIQQLNSR